MKAFTGLALLTCTFFISCNEASKPAAPEKKTESKHSAAFNQSFDAFLADYYAMAAAFVNWDSAAVDRESKALDAKLRDLSLEEIKKDSAVGNKAAEELMKVIMTNQVGISGGSNLTAKRRSFDELTQSIFDLLRTVRYDGKKIYLQECPMAFNDEEAAVWLTDKGKDSIRNPYLGLHHPRYKDAMLECGSNKSTIDFQNK